MYLVGGPSAHREVYVRCVGRAAGLRVGVSDPIDHIASLWGCLSAWGVIPVAWVLTLGRLIAIRVAGRVAGDRSLTGRFAVVAFLRSVCCSAIDPALPW